MILHFILMILSSYYMLESNQLVVEILEPTVKTFTKAFMDMDADFSEIENMARSREFYDL